MEFLRYWRFTRDLYSLGVREWVKEALRYFTSQNDVNDKLLRVLVVFVEAADIESRL